MWRSVMLAVALSASVVYSWGVMAEQLAPSPQHLAALGAGRGVPKVIAHRGGSKWAPENTLAAFRKCVDNGVYGLELDIHKCKTGELVVIHDDDLARTTTGQGMIKDTPLSEIRKLDAGSWFAAEYKGERVPLLSEVLELVDGKLVVNIEIKNCPVGYEGIEDDLLKLLEGYKHKDKIIISSFDHEVLQRIHQKTNQYKLGLLGDPIFADLGAYSSRIGGSAWHPYFGNLRVDAVEKAHKAGLEVNTWTVNERGAWEKAVTMGVDGIVTDDPKGLREYFVEAKLQ